jgi:DUF1707 SHOCT-like domain
MTHDHDIRASDAERTATADVLRRHHGEGRLDTAELEERLGRCYAAKTRGELDAVTADLPGTRSRPHDRRRSHGAVFPLPLLPIAVVVAVAIATHGHVLWLVFPLVFFTFFRFRWRHAHARGPSRRPH